MQSDYANLKVKLSILLPSLNEKQKRLLIGAEALALGRGGITRLAKITGMNRHTVARDVREYKTGDFDVNRVRDKGAGRKKLTIQYPEIKRNGTRIRNHCSNL